MISFLHREEKDDKKGIAETTVASESDGKKKKKRRNRKKKKPGQDVSQNSGIRSQDDNGNNVSANFEDEDKQHAETHSSETVAGTQGNLNVVEERKDIEGKKRRKKRGSKISVGDEISGTVEQKGKASVSAEENDKREEFNETAKVKSDTRDDFSGNSVKRKSENQHESKNSKKRKKMKEKMETVSGTPGASVTENEKETSEKSRPLSQENRQKKGKKKNKKNRKLQLSDERLKAYGINPKKYKYMKKEELFQIKSKVQ